MTWCDTLVVLALLAYSLAPLSAAACKMTWCDTLVVLALLAYSLAPLSAAAWYSNDDLSACGCRYRSKMTWCDTLVVLALLAYSLAPLSAAAWYSNDDLSACGCRYRSKMTWCDTLVVLALLAYSLAPLSAAACACGYRYRSKMTWCDTLVVLALLAYSLAPLSAAAWYSNDDLSACGCRYRSKMTWCDTLVVLALLAYSLAPLSAAAWYSNDDLSACGCRYRSKMTWCDTLVVLALLAYSLAPLSAAARHIHFTSYKAQCGGNVTVGANTFTGILPNLRTFPQGILRPSHLNENSWQGAPPPAITVCLGGGYDTAGVLDAAARDVGGSSVSGNIPLLLLDHTGWTIEVPVASTVPLLNITSKFFASVPPDWGLGIITGRPSCYTTGLQSADCRLSARIEGAAMTHSPDKLALINPIRVRSGMKI
ncbi:hypothetical protein J6590_023036 [Homalodisca vitripennis]|nr:hypothetical protein J6590_023036 [Homalodisca vitripennis]